jgi:DNA-binding HxlR family transcriptional regulator
MATGSQVKVTSKESHSPEVAAFEEPSKSCDGALTQAFKFLGKRWNGVILGTLTNGASGFAELRRNVIGISDSVLSERLSELQAAGLIVRAVESGPPVSVSYRLSDAGSNLIPALHALSVWAAENISHVDHTLQKKTTRLHGCW